MYYFLSIHSLCEPSDFGLLIFLMSAVTSAQLDISRVARPEYIPSQHATDSTNPNAANRWNTDGSVASDFPGNCKSGLLFSALVSLFADNILSKLVSSKLRDDAPDIYQLVAPIEMKKAYVIDILQDLKISGNSDTDYYNVACNWLNNNTALWNNW